MQVNETKHIRFNQVPTYFILILILTPYNFRFYPWLREIHLRAFNRRIT